MEKREKWMVWPAPNGKVWVVYRLKNDKPGNAITTAANEDSAWELIDSGLADELEKRGRRR
jgi:hypothetical protein